MANVTVTLTTSITCSYWLVPKAIEDITGLGISAPDIVQGFIPGYDTPQTVDLTLDDSYLYDVRVDFQNAAPIRFFGFQPSAGDLLTELAAQGWTPYQSNQ